MEKQITGIWIKHPTLENVSANILTGEIRLNKKKLTIKTRADMYQYVIMKRKIYLVHRLVLECKLQRKIQEGYECNHINHTPFDNRAENLEEVSLQQNRKDKKHIIQDTDKTPKIVVWNTKDADGNDLTLYFKSQYACSKHLGISSARVYQICSTKGKKAHNLSYINALPEGKAFVKTTVFKKDFPEAKKEQLRLKNKAYYLKNREKLKSLSQVRYMKKVIGSRLRHAFAIGLLE